MPRKISLALESLMMQRRREVTLACQGGLPTIPLIAYAYTSRVFPYRISELFSLLARSTPTFLVSLADLWFNCISAVDLARTIGRALRFFDCGTYEIRPHMLDPTGRAMPAPVSNYDLASWNYDSYLAAIRTYTQCGDILLSYDDVKLSPTEQVQVAVRLFSEVEDLNLIHDLIVHPKGLHNVRTVANLVRSHNSQIRLFAIPLDELPGGWVKRIRYVRQLRNMLNIISPTQYIYLHILGCIDPTSITHFFWAGADVFDGAGWLQYYFSEHHAYSFTDFEFQRDGQQKPAKLIGEMAKNNICYLEELRHSLISAVSNGETKTFGATLSRVAQALDGLLQ